VIILDQPAIECLWGQRAITDGIKEGGGGGFLPECAGSENKE
jgi:hypothetical protein